MSPHAGGRESSVRDDPPGTQRIAKDGGGVRDMRGIGRDQHERLV